MRTKTKDELDDHGRHVLAPFDSTWETKEAHMDTPVLIRPQACGDVCHKPQGQGPCGELRLAGQLEALGERQEVPKPDMKPHAKAKQIAEHL